MKHASIKNWLPKPQSCIETKKNKVIGWEGRQHKDNQQTINVAQNVWRQEPHFEIWHRAESFYQNTNEKHQTDPRLPITP